MPVSDLLAIVIDSAGGTLVDWLLYIPQNHLFPILRSTPLNCRVNEVTEMIVTFKKMRWILMIAPGMVSCSIQGAAGIPRTILKAGYALPFGPGVCVRYPSSRALPLPSLEVR